MNWDDVATQIRTLVDDVPPVGADEARNHQEPPVSGTASGPAWRKPTLAAAATIMVAAAVWAATTSSGDDAEPDVAATGSTTTATEGIEGTGPLALLDHASNEEALVNGTLEITDECTFVRYGESRELLVWPADRTTWSPRSGTIRVERLDEGPAVELADGDSVSLSGGYSLLTVIDTGPFDWVAEPSPSCGTDDAFVVGAQVEVVPG